MPECTRRGTAMAGRSGGLRDALGLTAYDGHECESCGALVCGEWCYRTHLLELAGTSHDRRPTCGERLRPR